MPGTHRCSRCGHDWPNTAHYLNCPDCHERTDYLYREEPMPFEEAESMRKRFLFRDWLEKETDYERATRRRLFDEQEREREEQKRQRLADLEAMLTDQPPLKEAA